VKSIFKTLGLYGYAGFCLFGIFTLTIHQYEWMLEEPGSRLVALCQLPPHKLMPGEMFLIACFGIAPLAFAGALEWRKRGKPGRLLWVAGALLAFCLFRLSRFLCPTA
jgi:4-amino-4-deoxy-L-arabinose transferase-like glycosyltransferase